MKTIRDTAFYQHYSRILSNAGIHDAERETILAAEVRDRIRQQRREDERAAREAICQAVTVRP